MKQVMWLMMVCAMVASAAPKVVYDGAEKGVWTMDYEAASKNAREQKVPLLVLFTGSDWCKWCKVMDNQVFSKPEWDEYAKNNLYLAYIDFPQDGKLVPDKFKERNDELQKRFEVEGYPTMILFDGDGEEVERLQADQKITPKKFIGLIRMKLLFTAPELAKVYAKLPPEEAKALKAKGDRRAQLMAELKKLDKILEDEIDVANKKHEKAAAPLNDELEKYEEFDKLVVKQLLKAKSPELLAEFEKAQTELEKEMESAMKWIQTKPEQNEANNKIYMEYRAKIDALREKTNGMVVDVLP